MDFKKIYKRGLGISFLLLIVFIGILFVPNLSKKQISDGNLISLNAPEDFYEPNDFYWEAYDISFDQDVWLSSINGTGTQADYDFYEIYINPGFEHLKVNLTFSHILGNIDILVCDNIGSPLTGSGSTTDNEYIDFIAPYDGVFYLQILGDNASNSYDLLWKSIPMDDAYEQNDYDGEAYDLISYSAMWLTSVSGPGYQWDEDWYLVYLDPGEERIRVELTFLHMEGDIDLEVYYYDGGTFTYLDGSYSTSDMEYIEVNAPWSGYYYIRVYGNDAGNEYDMFWEDLMPSSTDDDWMEENDDFWSSWYVDPNYYSGLRMVYNDDDWFRTYLRNGDTIDIAIYFKNVEGDLELELWDPSNTFRSGSYSGDDDEFISYNADMPGDWRIRVFHAFGDSELYYDLDIWVNAGEDPVDDWMEENDGFWSSRYVDPNYYSGLILNHDDEDWFHTYINIGDIIDVSIFFEHDKGDLGLELWDPSNTLRSGSYSGDDYENVCFMADMPGDWRIRVFHATVDSKNYYDLNLWIKDDFYEYNNEPQVFQEDHDHPSILAQHERTWLSDLYGKAVQGDSDWYIIDVTPGYEHLVIEVLFNHTLGNIGIDIYNSWGSYIVGNNSMTDDEYIDYYLPDYGIYAIHIYGSDMRNEYDMWWDDLKTDLRSDDFYEMNNDPSSAYYLMEYTENISLSQLNGFALQYDEDWYEIYISDSNLELIVAVIYDSAEGLIGFNVYDENLNKITGNMTLTDNDYIIHEVSNGTYYIKVFGDNSGNVYDLLWFTREPEEFGLIPGYDLLILIVSVLGISTIVINRKRSKFKHK
ncbi:MAG: PPC domain-containing protein [Promethearchaeota archaeon]